MARKEKDVVWPANVLGPEFERMFSVDPCQRVVILERLLGVSLLIRRPKGNSKRVKIKRRKIKLARIMQLIEQGRTLDVTETEIINHIRAKIPDPVCGERPLLLARIRGKEGDEYPIGRTEVVPIVSEAKLILRVHIGVNVELIGLRSISIGKYGIDGAHIYPTGTENWTGAVRGAVIKLL